MLFHEEFWYEIESLITLCVFPETNTIQETTVPCVDLNHLPWTITAFLITSLSS